MKENGLKMAARYEISFGDLVFFLLFLPFLLLGIWIKNIDVKMETFKLKIAKS